MIGVGLTRKQRDVAARMNAHRSANYDAVICFCSNSSSRFYQRLAAENDWPKLVIRNLSKPA